MLPLRSICSLVKSIGWRHHMHVHLRGTVATISLFAENVAETVTNEADLATSRTFIQVHSSC